MLCRLSYSVRTTGKRAAIRARYEEIHCGRDRFGAIAGQKYAAVSFGVEIPSI